jgi:MFS family permease
VSRTLRRHGPLSSFVDGIGEVRRVAALPPVVALIGVRYFARGAEMVLFVYVVRDELGAPVEQVGLLTGAVGLGALAAMLIAARATDTSTPVRPIVYSLLATALPMAALALVTSSWAAAAVLLVVGAGMVVFEVVIVVMVQRITPPSRLGRVFGAVNGASNTGKLAGALVAPLLIATLGVDGSLVVVAAGVLLGGLAAAWPLVAIGRVAAERQRQLAPTVSLLHGLPIFEGASGPTLERIAMELVECEVAAGTVVIAQDEPADDLYVARSGTLVVSRDGVEIGSIAAGDWFGEIGLLEHRPRTATVTAIEPTAVWRIPGAVFLDALDDAGAPPSALLEGIADRLATHRA